MSAMRCIGRYWMTCLLGFGVTALSPVLASPVGNQDAIVDHYELKEKITRSGTRVDFNFDESVQSIDHSGNIEYHEDNHDIFEQDIAPVSGDDPATNNNGRFYSDSDHNGGTGPWSYTHFLRNPGLSADNRALMTGFSEDSLIEFSLKLDFHDAKKNTLLSVWALPVLGGGSGLDLASGVTAKDLEDKKINFNLYDDFGNAATIASINTLAGFLAASPDGGIRIDIDIDKGSDDLKLKSSELELEFAVVPEPPVWSLLLLLFVVAVKSGYRRSTARRV